MPEVRTRHLLVVLAALAIVLATWVMLVVRRLVDASFPSPISLVLIGIGMGWVGLASFYMALGRQRLVLRLAVSAAGALAGGAVAAFGERWEVPDYANWCGVTLFGLFLVAAPLVYLWARGLRLTHPEHPPLVYWKPRGQFSLWGLLTALTCTGVLLAIAVRLQFPIGNLYAVMTVCGSIGVITYAAAGTLLSREQSHWAVIAIPVATVATGIWLSSIDSGFSSKDLLASGGATAVISVWMLVLRAAGYSLRWPDYAAIETVGPSKRLVDEQGRPVDEMPPNAEKEQSRGQAELQSNHSSEQSNFG